MRFLPVLAPCLLASALLVACGDDSSGPTSGPADPGAGTPGAGGSGAGGSGAAGAGATGGSAGGGNAGSTAGAGGAAGEGQGGAGGEQAGGAAGAAGEGQGGAAGGAAGGQAGSGGPAADDCCGNPADPCGWVGDGICQQAGFCSWGQDPDCATTAPDGVFALTLRGEGFAAAAGAMARAWVIDSFGALLATGEGAVEGGAFSMTWPKLLPESTEGYQVRYFVDANGDGLCGQGEQEGSAQTGLVILPIELSVKPTNLVACAAPPTGSSLRLDGKGFAVADGVKVRAQVTHQGSLSVVATAETTTQGGAFKVLWPALLQEKSTYLVSYALDALANGVCDAKGDIAGTLTAKGGMGDVTLEAAPQAQPPADACKVFKQGGFNLVVRGSGFTADEGVGLRLQVFRGEAGTGIFGQTTISKGAFEIALEGALTSEGPHFVGYYLDKNASGLCEIGTDPAWYLDLGTPTADVEVEVKPDASQNNAGCWTDG